MPAVSRRIKSQKEDSKLLLTYKVLSIIFALIIIVQTIYIFYPSLIFQTAANVAIPDLSTSGFVKIDKITTGISGSDGVLTLRSGCYELSAGVEPYMSVSIQNALDGKVEARPNAHDIAKDVFSTLKIDMLMAKVTERRENAFFAKIVLRQGNTILNFDARPSDAIAIAIRMKAGVYMNETLLKTEGKKIC
jgi:bifunctional DNase/RNase